ncbi:MAG: FGGY family carbohydrate kinase [candidate division KSB1 bacterium]
MNSLFAGLDVSTQSCKLVVIDTDANAIVFVDAVNYDDDLPQYGTRNGVKPGLAKGVSESEPGMWIAAVEEIFSKLNASKIPMAKIKCISVSGQQHGLVSLDAHGNLTRPTSKLWNDFSTLEECEILTEKIGGLAAMIEEVGNSQRTGYTAAKIFHMARHEPEEYAKSATFFLVHNYINFYLSGGVRVLEPGDLSGMALWNPKTAQWSQRVLAAIAADLRQKLPAVQPSNATIGNISSDLVARFGFSPTCKIDAGSGDNMYGAIGTGNVSEGSVTISLGTSGTAYCFMREPFVDPSGEIAAFCDSTGHYLPLLCVSNLANGYDALLAQYQMSHAEFNAIIKQTKAGNEGRVLVPWYIGERTPDVPFAAPVYFGFGLDEFTKKNICRAVLEGHLLNLYDGFRRMPVAVKEIRITGGLAKSEAWCQTIADIFESETIPVEGEGAALGAALHAAWVWKKENGEEVSLERLTQVFVVLQENRRRRPLAQNVPAYRIQKRLFTALSARLRGLTTGDDPFALKLQLSA